MTNETDLDITEDGELVTPKAHCYAVRGFLPSGQYTAFGCGQWRCEACRKVLVWKVAERAKLGMLKFGQTWFITYTEPGSIKTPQYAYNILPEQWDNVRNALQYVYKQQGLEWEYLTVVEGQPERDSMPHFHVLQNVPIPFDRFKWKRNKDGKTLKPNSHDFAVHCGFGHQAKIELVHSDDIKRLISYVAKVATYLSKDNVKVDMPKNFRRVRYSRGWPELRGLPPSELIVQRYDESTVYFISRAADRLGVSYDTLKLNMHRWLIDHPE